MSNFKLSSRSIARLAGVEPELLDVTARAIQITKVDFGIPEYGGMRTPQVQNHLFKTVNKFRGPDGYEKIGKHQEGKAVDFYAYVLGAATWEELYLSQVAAAFLQAGNELNIPVRWGGLFKSWFDGPHIELIED